MILRRKVGYHSQPPFTQKDFTQQLIENSTII